MHMIIFKKKRLVCSLPLPWEEKRLCEGRGEKIDLKKKIDIEKKSLAHVNIFTQARVCFGIS